MFSSEGADAFSHSSLLFMWLSLFEATFSSPPTCALCPLSSHYLWIFHMICTISLAHDHHQSDVPSVVALWSFSRSRPPQRTHEIMASLVTEQALLGSSLWIMTILPFLNSSAARPQIVLLRGHLNNHPVVVIRPLFYLAFLKSFMTWIYIHPVILLFIFFDFFVRFSWRKY